MTKAKAVHGSFKKITSSEERGLCPRVSKDGPRQGRAAWPWFETAQA
jgi:hypothetical protein